jgi:hypothetical protein
MRLVTDVHAALVRWSEWAAEAVTVLESEDEAAIERQTQTALTAVATAGKSRVKAQDCAGTLSRCLRR